MPEDLSQDPVEPTCEIAAMAAEAQLAQAAWAVQPVAQRLGPLKRLRPLLVEAAPALMQAITLPQRHPGETLAAEVLPLAEAVAFLWKTATKTLAPETLSTRGRPLWLRGVSLIQHREPYGMVLIIAPSNYPLFLAGVQILQALVAGNAVLVKPAVGGTAVLQVFRRQLETAGFPAGLFQILPEAPSSVAAALATGVQIAVLTGSRNTGRKVMRQLAEYAVPAIMELSGSDAIIVLPGASLETVARAVVFGVTLNGSATCMAPRRVFVPRELETALISKLCELLTGHPTIPVDTRASSVAQQAIAAACAQGARIASGSPPIDQNAVGWLPVVLAGVTAEMSVSREDLFAPVTSILACTDLPDAIAAYHRSPYALTAAIFGPREEAVALAARLHAGCVLVNDVIAPTADPRLAFGGWNHSGFGVTRGREGLLAMTRLKTVLVQRGRWLPHLTDLGPPNVALVQGLLAFLHAGTIYKRFSGLMQLISAARSLRKKDS